MTRLTPEQIAEIKARHEKFTKDLEVATKYDAYGEWASEIGLEEYEAVGALLSHIEADGWQPIETAPKDGREILILERGRAAIVSWRTDWFAKSAGPTWLDNSHDDFSTGYASVPYTPSCWRPLPLPPKTNEV